MVGAVVAPREEGGHDGKSWRSEGSGGRHWMSVLFAVDVGVAPSCRSHSVYLSCPRLYRTVCDPSTSHLLHQGISLNITTQPNYTTSTAVHVPSVQNGTKTQNKETR